MLVQDRSRHTPWAGGSWTDVGDLEGGGRGVAIAHFPAGPRLVVIGAFDGTSSVQMYDLSSWTAIGHTPFLGQPFSVAWLPHLEKIGVVGDFSVIDDPSTGAELRCASFALFDFTNRWHVHPAGGLNSPGLYIGEACSCP